MFIYLLSKLAPALILPLGLSLLLLIAHMYWKKRFLISGIFILLTSLSLKVVSQTLWRLVESPWIRIPVELAPEADAIVVLSGGGINPAPGAAEIIEWRDPDRFLAGVNLFKKRKASKILFTGGTSPFTPRMPKEGQFYIKEAIKFGIPIEAMSSTGAVQNTAEEAYAVREMLKLSEKKSRPKILLVTSAFHMKRAKKLFERQGHIVFPFPVDFKAQGRWAMNTVKDPSAWLPNAKCLSDSSSAIREFLGRIVYKIW